MSEIYNLLQEGKKLLLEYNIDNPRLDAEILLAYALGLEQKKIFFNSEVEIDKDKKDLFINLIKRRCNREPVSRITGKRGFWKYDFYISKETLDPRPDTETLIEAVLSEIKNNNNEINILDLGTGSGCIAVSLAGEFLKAKVTGIDISEDAVKTAEKNAKEQKLQEKCKFIVMSWNELEKISPDKFDIIVSNPPYIKEEDIKKLEPEVSDYDPLTALSGGKSGLNAYLEISKKIIPLLKETALVFLEIGEGQKEEVVEIFEKNNFIFYKEYQDLAKKIRCLSFKVKKN